MIASGFIDFMEAEFSFQSHLFILTSKNPEIIKKRTNIIDRINFKNFFRVYKELKKAKKIIIHGFFSPPVILFLYAFRNILKKSYWVIWGGDLYVYRQRKRSWKRRILEYFRRPVIKKMPFLVTYIKGDYELAKKWYGAEGEYLHCIMYPSNLFKEPPVSLQKTDTKTHILVGNSADPSNEHIEIFNKILPFKEADIVIYAPLVYGNKTYANTIIKKGQELFGDKFIPITNALSSEKYTDFLSKMDIAIFAHRRQQAMGNTVTLLGLGKKVYLRQDVSSWEVLESLNVKTFDFNGKINMGLLSKSTALQNKMMIKNSFSKDILYTQLNKIFQKK